MSGAFVRVLFVLVSCQLFLYVYSLYRSGVFVRTVFILVWCLRTYTHYFGLVFLYVYSLYWSGIFVRILFVLVQQRDIDRTDQARTQPPRFLGTWPAR